MVVVVVELVAMTPILRCPGFFGGVVIVINLVLSLNDDLHNNLLLRGLNAFATTICYIESPAILNVLLQHNILLLGNPGICLMASLKQKKRDFRIAHHGGLKQTEQFLGLRDIKDFDPSLDVVFVSIDLEVSRQEKGKPGAPLVKEFGIATLDTRHLKSLASPSVATKSISTLQFSTSHASKDFLDCDFTDFKECVFAETLFVSQTDLPTTITKCLCIQDNSSPDSHALRNIVIVGHSTKTDLKILQRLGVNIYDIVPVLAILDTHLIARNLLGANSIFLKGTAPMTSFNLGALLAELKCPYENSDLHNAGNDATFTLNAMLMLAIKSSESREMGSVERENLERLRAMTQVELSECQRWKPTRTALGFYAPGSPNHRKSNAQNNQINQLPIVSSTQIQNKQLSWKDEADSDCHSRSPSRGSPFPTAPPP
jgi:hypothetical protein